MKMSFKLIFISITKIKFLVPGRRKAEGQSEEGRPLDPALLLARWFPHVDVGGDDVGGDEDPVRHRARGELQGVARRRHGLALRPPFLGRNSSGGRGFEFFFFNSVIFC